jgi:hypothetical protein
LLVLGAALASGQSVRWQPDRGALGFGQTTELQLIFEDCSPDGTPSLPAVPGLSMELAGQSQSWETINFSMTRRVILTYMARATQKGTLRIPSFETKTDKGAVRVRQAEFQVGDATVGQSGASLDSIVQSRLNLPDTDVWAGEVFPLSYTLSIARRFSAQLASNVEWSSTPLAAEDWAKPEMADVMVGGENRTVVTYRARAMSKGTGRVPLKQAQQLVNLQTGTSTFGLIRASDHGAVHDHFAASDAECETTAGPSSHSFSPEPWASSPSIPKWFLRKRPSANPSRGLWNSSE